MSPKDLTEYQWKPGQSGNPRGTHAWPAGFQQVRKLSKAEVVEVGSMLLKNDMAAIEELLKDPASTVLQHMVAAVAKKIIRYGDAEALNNLLNRLIGPVRTEVSHHIIVGQTLVERVAAVLEKRLKDHPELLMLIADDLQGLLDGDGDDAEPIDVSAAPQAQEATGAITPQP